ncbi:MAG: hypothetical protein OJJ55_09380 [Rhodococcus sp.]|nr:hypothetical protein [Rhodococcus sp. (in: high G+C Gram-positive bacteria)]
MTQRDEIPRKPTRILTAGEIEREVAGIRAGLEMGGVPFTAEAEIAARSVLAGDLTGDEAIELAHAAIRRRHGL